MPIRFVSGLPRAGKTFNVVQNYIIPALEDGRHVVTNVLLRLDTIYKAYPKASITYFDKQAPIRKDSNISKYLNLDNYPDGSVFVLDEFWRYLETGTRQDKMEETVKTFFTEHGHCVSDKGFTTEIILISQSALHVNTFVKSLIDETIFIEKQDNLGKPFYICHFHDYYFNHLDSKREPKHSARGYYDIKHKEIPVGDFYVSNTKNQQTEFNKGLEVKIDKRANPLNKPIVKLGIPVAFGFVCWGLYTAIGFFSGDAEASIEEPPVIEEPLEPEKSVVTNTLTPQPLDLPDVKPKEHGLSSNWRLIGHIRSDKKGFALIADNSGNQRKIDFNQHCQFYPNTDEVHCSLSGAKITKWSGRNTQTSPVNRLFSSNINVDNNTGDNPY